MSGRSGVNRIVDERARQVGGECYGVEHDDQHVGGELARTAAGCLGAEVRCQ